MGRLKVAKGGEVGRKQQLKRVEEGADVAWCGECRVEGMRKGDNSHTSP